jgi:hypothetical protein
VIYLMPVDCALGEFEPLRYAPVWGTGDQRFIDAVPLQVIAHGAPSGHGASLLLGSQPRC